MTGARRHVGIGAFGLVAVALAAYGARAEDLDPYAPVRPGSWEVWAVSIVVDGRELIADAAVNGLCVLDSRWRLHRWPDQAAVPHPQPLQPGFEGALSARSGAARAPPRGQWFEYDVGWAGKPRGLASQTARDQRRLLVPFPLDGAGAPARADLLRLWFFEDCSPAVLTEQQFMVTMRSLSRVQRRVLVAIFLEWEVWALPPTLRIPPDELRAPAEIDYDIMRAHADSCRRNASRCREMFNDLHRISVG